MALPEGSWGAESNNSVWLNEDTAWTWKHIYPAELAVQQMANSGLWHGNETATRLAKQICRELLLLESSDWQFLITTKSARDYAEKRFNTHLEQFRALLDTWRRFEATRQIPPGEAAGTGSDRTARLMSFPKSTLIYGPRRSQSCITPGHKSA